MRTPSTPKSELILAEIRKLNAQMNAIDPDPTQVRKFRDLFLELDALLQSGAKLPPSWLTRDNYTTLPPHVTHTITDFDTIREERLRSQGLAFCGHHMASATGHCVIPSCGNYLYRHYTPNTDLTKHANPTNPTTE